MAEFFYTEPRFAIPYWGRFAFRLLSYAGGAFAVAVGLVLLLSDIVPLKAAAILIGILVLYYLLRNRVSLVVARESGARCNEDGSAGTGRGTEDIAHAGRDDPACGRAGASDRG